MDNYQKLKKPNIGRFPPDKLIMQMQKEGLLEPLEQANSPEYLYWDKFRKQKFLLKHIEPEKLWAILKLRRKFAFIKTPVKDYSGRNFSYLKLAKHDEILFEIDSHLKHMADDEVQFSKGKLKEFIASEILSGAEITESNAKKIIYEKTPAKSYLEKSVFEHFKSFEEILASDKITIESLKQLAGAGFRGDSESHRFVNYKGKILYIAPVIKIAEQELAELINYINGGGEFIHPIIKATIIYFWFSILRPFRAENGRIARALFYWFLLKNGYEKLIYFSFSEKLADLQNEISQVFVYAEQDDNDITYFVDFILRKLHAAFFEFSEQYRIAKSREQNQISYIQRENNYNERQIKLLRELATNPHGRTNFSSYMKIYNVTRRTTALDLTKLVAAGELEKRRIGKNQFYYLNLKR